MDENFDIKEEDMLPILVNGLMNRNTLCRYLWSKTLSWGVDRGGEEEELDDLLLLPSEDKDFINLRNHLSPPWSTETFITPRH